MPVQSGGDEGAAKPGTGGAPFAQVPLWDRDRKAPAGRRPTSDPAMDSGEPGPAGLVEPVDAAYETQPADANVQTGAPARGQAPVGAVLIGAAVLAVIVAAGWFASRPHDRGVPELTPGGPAASPVAYVTVAPPDEGAVNPVNPAPPVAAKPAPEGRHAASPARPPKAADHPAPRVRPAPSAAEAGANASATAAPTITPPTPGSPSTDPMTVNPAPMAPTVPQTPAAPHPSDPGTTP